MLLSLLKVKGHSMEPKIKQGSTVLVSSLPYLFGSPKKDDIVVFKINNKLLIKRIYKIDNKKYYLQGDNNADSLETEPIKLEKILGKVIYVVMY